MEVVASLSQGRTAAAQCGLFTHQSVPVIFEPPCTNGVQCLVSTNGNLVKFEVERADEPDQLVLKIYFLDIP